MFGPNNRNNFETYEDYEAHPVGKHMLKMPYLWEEGEYPKKASELAQANTAIEAQPDPAAAFEPVKFSTKPLIENPVQPITNAWGNDMESNLKTLGQLKPKPAPWREHQQSFTQAKPETAQTSTFPYGDMGKLVKPVSDKVIEKGVEPTAKAFVQSVKSKEPVAAAEQDLVNVTGNLTKPVTSYLHNTYTKDNITSVMPAIAYGEGLGHADDMENPDMDALKGFKNTWG